MVVFVFLAIGASMTLRRLTTGVWRVEFLDGRAATAPRPDPARLPHRGRNGLTRALLAATALPAGALPPGRWPAATHAALRCCSAGPSSALAVVAGWYVTGHLGHIAEHPDTLGRFLATNSGRAESLSFVAPRAFTLELLLLWSDANRQMSFGIASALGVVASAAATALATRTFRIEGFATQPTSLRHIAGGLLMGFGGVTALGCTLGQGVSGLSTGARRDHHHRRDRRGRRCDDEVPVLAADAQTPGVPRHGSIPEARGCTVDGERHPAARPGRLSEISPFPACDVRPGGRNRRPGSTVSGKR